MDNPWLSGSPHQVALKAVFGMFGIYPAKAKKYKMLLQREKEREQCFRRMELLKVLPEGKASFFAQNFEFSHSQFFQDLFVASELGIKQGGFFVEVGACDGIRLSNTLFFERQWAWPGILAEPGRSWQSALKRNRKACVDPRAVWHTSGLKLLFNEPVSKEVSTLDQFSSDDFHADLRSDGVRYEVETVSLNDLLETHNAPEKIDYLSLDTEGSEYEILKEFDFQRRIVRCITCEHNFTPNRDKVFKLLTRQGYLRKYQEFSDCDDWYFFKE